MVPVRDAPVPFAEAVYEMVAEAVPAVGAPTLSQFTPLAAVHVQVPPVSNRKLLLAPLAATLCVLG